MQQLHANGFGLLKEVQLVNGLNESLQFPHFAHFSLPLLTFCVASEKLLSLC